MRFGRIYLWIVFGLVASGCASLGTRGKASDPPSAVKIVASDLKSQFKASIAAQSGKLPGRLGMMNIVNGDGSKSRLGAILADRLTKELFEPGIFLLLERDRLNRVIGEQTFQESGLVLSDQTASIGRLAGAEYLLLGQIVFEDQDFLLSLRIVSLSGVIFAAAEVRFDSDDDTYSQFRSSI